MSFFKGGVTNGFLNEEIRCIIVVRVRKKRIAMKYGNKILRKYLRLCTCNFPISDYTSCSFR